MTAIRTALIIMLGFVILAAIRGGVALFAAGDEIAIEWLGAESTTIFALPAIVVFAASGASLIALIAVIMRPVRGSLTAMIPGVLLAGYVAVELLLLRRNPPIPTGVGIFYLVLGCLSVALAVLLRRQTARMHRTA